MNNNFKNYRCNHKKNKKRLPKKENEVKEGLDISSETQIDQSIKLI